MTKPVVIVDCETYPNCFIVCAEMGDSDLSLVFEISDRRNDSVSLYSFLSVLRDQEWRMVGFNILGFDGPILQLFMSMGGRATAGTLYDKAQAIIQSQDDDLKFAHIVRPSDRFCEQLDLFRIHHFHNRARSTSLKVLEFNMRMNSIQDLPFPVGSTLTHDQMVQTAQYCAHDVRATKIFYHRSSDMIRFREELTERYQRDFLNHDDTKIGKDYFVMELEAAGVACYDYGPQGRQPRQTRRPSIALKDAILPWITFQEPEFQRMLEWLKAQTITETTGVFTDVTATVRGFTFVFGLGGIHGSVESEIVEASDSLVIESVDVTSMYPNIAISNGFYPEHLGPTFVTIYQHLYEERKKHPKGSPENAMLKLALNGCYGDSNNPYSVFYDSLFTMKVTLSGQMLICMLVDRLITVPTVRIIMSNTDGIEYTVHPDYVEQARARCREWEQLTKLNLEYARYRKMCIMNVNNYLAEYLE
jgi:hypothetical protein